MTETVRATAEVDTEGRVVTWTYEPTLALGADDEVETPPFFGVKTGDTVELRVYRKGDATQ